MTTGDFQLTPNFSFFDLTRTDAADLQEENRREGLAVRHKLLAVAEMMESAWDACGPLEKHSGFRCRSLNARIGGSAKSQHMLGEAIDFSGPGDDDEKSLEALFQKVLSSLISKAVPFGQLIKEEADRGYSVVRWLHLSLGQPFREEGRCGQVLTMKKEPGKKAVYTLLKQVPIGR